MGAADGAVYGRHSAKVDGVDVAYLRGGRLEQYSPVVYLHGMGPSGRWESYHMAMGTVTDIWAPQLPGWAEGTPPEGIGTLEDYARLLFSFLDGAGIGEATLVGHCVGGWLALQLAVQQPERFRRLVLVDALGLAWEDTPAVELAALDDEAFATGVFARLGVIATADPTGFGAAWENVRQGPEFVRQSKGRGTLLSQTGGAIGDAALTAAAGELTADTLLVWGAVDGIAPLSQAEALRERMPNARLAVVDGAGHLPMAERPETFNRLLRNFVISSEETVPNVEWR